MRNYGHSEAFVDKLELSRRFVLRHDENFIITCSDLAVHLRLLVLRPVAALPSSLAVVAEGHLFLAVETLHLADC